MSNEKFLEESTQTVDSIQAYLDELKMNGAEIPDSLLKITKNGTAITKSDIEGFKECVPLRYIHLPVFVSPPSPNASGGQSGGGAYLMGLVGLAVDSNANIGDTAGCFFSQENIEVGILNLNKVDGGYAVKYGYEMKECKIVMLPRVYRKFKILLVRGQNLTFVENAFGVDGKKLGKEAAGSFDLASGKTAAG